MTKIKSSPTKRKEKKKAQTKQPAEGLKVSQDLIIQIERAAGIGLTDRQILAFFDVSMPEWENAILRHPRLKSALDRGRASMIHKVANKLIEKIESGNLDAIKFYLKTKGGYLENGEGTTSSAAYIPSISLTVNDPIEAARIYQNIMRGSD